MVVSSGLSYTDSGLSAGTSYSYTIDAQDNAGNLSAQSPAISVSTQTSPSPPPPSPPAPTYKPGDINHDGAVNVFDLSILLSHYSTAYNPADIDGNGAVNIFDLSILLSHYGT